LLSALLFVRNDKHQFGGFVYVPPSHEGAGFGVQI
jgi:hypothetical protein